MPRDQKPAVMDMHLTSCEFFFPYAQDTLLFRYGQQEANISMTTIDEVMTSFFAYQNVNSDFILDFPLPMTFQADPYPDSPSIRRLLIQNVAVNYWVGCSQVAAQTLDGNATVAPVRFYMCYVTTETSPDNRTGLNYFPRQWGFHPLLGSFSEIS